MPQKNKKVNKNWEWERELKEYLDWKLEDDYIPKFFVDDIIKRVFVLINTQKTQNLQALKEEIKKYKCGKHKRLLNKLK